MYHQKNLPTSGKSTLDEQILTWMTLYDENSEKGVLHTHKLKGDL